MKAIEKVIKKVKSSRTSLTTVTPIASTGDTDTVGLDLYKNTSLQHPHSIRLLVLEPASSTKDELRAEFRGVMLGKSPEYEAISYTWGEPDFSEPLWLDNNCARITKSLAAALRRVRFKKKRRILWADAICINQKDLQEKSRQVALMAQIYSQASRVLVWLGPGTEETKIAASGLRELAQMATKHGITSSDYYIEVTPHTIDTGFLNIAHLAMNYSIEAIYSLPWFKRVWTVQEFVLAKEITMFCGDDELDWPTFATATRFLMAAAHSDHGPWRDPISLLEATNIIVMRSKYRIQSIPSLHIQGPYANPNGITGQYYQFGQIVDYIRGRDCTDDRDRIYGVLSLRSPRVVINVIPDYTKSVAEVFVDFANELLKLNELQVFYDAGIWQRQSATAEDQEELPSWVPDYRQKARRGWIPRPDNSCARSNRQVCVIVSDRDRKRIQLSAVIVDTVVQSVDVWAPNADVFTVNSPLPFRDFRNAALACKKAFEQHIKTDKYLTGEDAEIAFARTVLADGSGSKFRQFLKVGSITSTEAFRYIWKEYESNCLGEAGEVYRRDLRLPYDITRGYGFENDLSRGGKAGLDAYGYVRDTLHGTSFVVGEKGYLSLAPLGTQAGDVIALVDGAPTPFILHPADLAGTEFRLVGPAFVHGMMYGEMEDIVSDSITVV